VISACSGTITTSRSRLRTASSKRADLRRDPFQGVGQPLGGDPVRIGQRRRHVGRKLPLPADELAQQGDVERLSAEGVAHANRHIQLGDACQAAHHHRGAGHRIGNAGGLAGH
jgi:hypothetical protein